MPISVCLCASLAVLLAVVSARGIDSKIRSNLKKLPFSEGPLQVFVGMYVESLGKFQSTDMSFDMDLYLYTSWKDPSLNHTYEDHFLLNDRRARELIWLPDLYFANARSAHFHDVTAPNFNIFIAQDGTVSYSSRVTLNVACNLHLVNYPMDKQTCGIKVLSYAYIARQVSVRWFRKEPIRYNSEINLPEFVIRGIDVSYCNGTYDYAITDGNHKTDKFSCLEGNIKLRRSIGYHLVQSYIPTGLIVIISWVSFWIDRRAVPARVTLSFTTLLSLSTLGNGLRYGLPQVSYAKAIDLWFGACMFFVFASLLEFAIVNTFMRRASKSEKLASKFDGSNVGRIDVYDEDDYDFYFPPLSKERIGLLAPRKTIPSDTAAKEAMTSVENEDATRTLAASNIAADKGTHGSLSEDAMRNAIWGINAKKDNCTNGNPAARASNGHVEFNVAQFNCHMQNGFTNARKALNVDKWSRMLFPLSYLGFNILYWWYYLFHVQRVE